MTDRLPPLRTLRAFEAVGRRLSMTLAAEELRLTHGAVSRQNDDSRLVVNCGVSFASKWLTSRLHRLMARYPDFDVLLEVADAPIDFATGHVDVALRYGAGQYPAAAAERIMNETVSPVCAPGYRDRMGGLSSPGDLARCQLVHEIGMNTTWERWFSMMGLPYPRMRGSGYTLGSMSIEAAIRGEGVALGRSVLVAEDLAAGRLVSLFPQARLDVEWGYDLVYRIGSHDEPKVRAFRNWMIEEVREFASVNSLP